MASGRRVLNLFSYAGGFSLFAARGGASHVTSVDVAAGAHATAQASFREAGVDPAAHAFVTAEVRAFLDGARARNDRWDLIVSDPPSFAPSERAVPRALTAYRELDRACIDVLAPGALFCAASCSSRRRCRDVPEHAGRCGPRAPGPARTRLARSRARPSQPAGVPGGEILEVRGPWIAPQPASSVASSVTLTTESRGPLAMIPRGSNTCRSCGATLDSELSTSCALRR